MVALPKPSAFAAGLVLQRRYRLDEPLVVEEITELWQGKDLVLDRPVAIKLLHPQLVSDPRAVEPFQREAIAIARLSHPHIVPTYDAGVEDGCAYIVLGLIHGPTLAEVLQRHHFDLRRCLSVGHQIADALACAHRAGVVHGNLDTSSVLLVDDEQGMGDQLVMVADFGIARAVKLLEDEKQQVDTFSDVQALALILHQLFSVDQLNKLPSLTNLLDRAVNPEPSGNRPSASDIYTELVAPGRSIPELGQVEHKSAASNTRSTTQPTPRQSAVQPHPQSTPPTTQVPFVNSSEQKNPTVSPPAVQKPAGRRLVWLALLGVVLVIVAVLAGRLLKPSSNKPATTSPSTQTNPLTVSAANSFDPFGDHTESQSQTPALIDNNPSTAWSTETYANRHFGNLKSGVGVDLVLQTPAHLHQLVVDSTSSDWAISVYVADHPAADLASWGPPVISQSAMGSHTVIDLGNRQGGAVLLWITDLGTTNRVSISELHLID